MSTTIKKSVGITRKKTIELLAGLIQRARDIEKNPACLYRVYRMAVFGSYLSDKPKLGDIDIAVEFSSKERNQERHREKYNAEAASAPGPTHFNRLVYPKYKNVAILRAKHHAFSFHEFDDLQALLRENPATPHQMLYVYKGTAPEWEYHECTATAPS